MLTHIQVWTAIDRLAARAGLSPSGLARKAGLEPTRFSRWNRTQPQGKSSWPTTDSLAKSLAASGTSMERFVQLMDDAARQISHGVPLIGLSQAGNGGYFDDAGLPV